MKAKEWVFLLVSLVLLPVPACGQRRWVHYGDTAVYTHRYDINTAWYPYCVYETSTIKGAAKDVMYDMWQTCEKVLGNQLPQNENQVPFRVDFIRFYVDSHGRMRYLVFKTPREAKTKDESTRMQKLLRELRKMRFPPFDRMIYMPQEANIDSVWFGCTVPRPKGNISREEYEWW